MTSESPVFLGSAPADLSPFKLASIGGFESMLTPAHIAIGALGALVIAVDTSLPSVVPTGIAGTIFTIFTAMGFGGWGLSVGLDRIIKFRQATNIELQRQLDAALQKIEALQTAADALITKTDKRVSDREAIADARVESIRRGYESQLTQLRKVYDGMLTEKDAAMVATLESLRHERETNVKLSDATLLRSAPVTHDTVRVTTEMKVIPDPSASSAAIPVVAAKPAGTPAPTSATLTFSAAGDPDHEPR